MKRSLVRQFNWSPFILDQLYHDAEDEHGLIFWYEDVVDIHKELNKK